MWSRFLHFWQYILVLCSRFDCQPCVTDDIYTYYIRERERERAVIYLECSGEIRRVEKAFGISKSLEA